MHVMTKEQAAKYKIDFQRAATKWESGTFQHFKDDAERKRHEDYVKQLQDSKAVPF